MGGGTRSFEMARRLVAWGHEVDLITSDTDPQEGGTGNWRRSDEQGVRVHWLPIRYDNRMGYVERVRAFIHFALSAAVRASRTPADVVFATSTPLTIAIPALIASRIRGIPMVFEVRDLWPDVPVALGAIRHPAAIRSARWLEWVAYHGAASVVALSPGMAAGVAARGVDSDRIQLIPNAADLDMFKPDRAAAREVRGRYPWLGDRPLVVYTGTLGLVNGVGYLVRLAAEVRKRAPEVRFLIVGDGREREVVQSLARDLGVLDETLFMLPTMPKREVASILSAADLATSLVIDIEALWANSANKFFDGLASGTPFAVNHEGWQADLLRREEAGLVLPVHDAAAAAKIVVAALADREWCVRAGSNARRLAATDFSRDVLTRRLEATLESALVRTAPRRSA